MRKNNHYVTQSCMLNYQVIYRAIIFFFSRDGRTDSHLENFLKRYSSRSRRRMWFLAKILKSRSELGKQVPHELHHAGVENFRVDTSLLADGGDRKREREVPKAGRMRYVVGGKKTKRSLGGPPWNRVLLVFAAASSVPAGALGVRRSRGMKRSNRYSVLF